MSSGFIFLSSLLSLIASNLFFFEATSITSFASLIFPVTINHRGDSDMKNQTMPTIKLKPVVATCRYLQSVKTNASNTATTFPQTKSYGAKTAK